MLSDEIIKIAKKIKLSKQYNQNKILQMLLKGTGEESSEAAGDRAYISYSRRHGRDY